MTPQEWLACAEAISRRNADLDIKQFIEDTLGPGRYRPRPRKRQFGDPPLFFDISDVYRPADRVAFGRVAYS